MRWRTPLATFVLLALLALYTMAVVALSDLLPANRFVDFVYYLAAGLLWVIPAGWLICWSARDYAKDTAAERLDRARTPSN